MPDGGKQLPSSGLPASRVIDHVVTTPETEIFEYRTFEWERINVV